MSCDHCVVAVTAGVTKVAAIDDAGYDAVAA
jgi:copper chaperone CopZ